MEMTNDQYIEEGGNRCPACNSGNISAESMFESDSAGGWRKVVCYDCNARWNDIYVLVGYELVETE